MLAFDHGSVYLVAALNEYLLFGIMTGVASYCNKMKNVSVFTNTMNFPSNFGNIL